jgi:hypothetical protein
MKTSKFLSLLLGLALVLPLTIRADQDRDRKDRDDRDCEDREHSEHSAKTPVHLIGAITVPGNPLLSADIAWVDPGTERYYLADRSNFGVDIIDAEESDPLSFSYVGRVTGMVGPMPSGGGTAVTNGPGPNGVVVTPNRHLWVGDGNSTVLVADVDPSSGGYLTIIKSISTSIPACDAGPGPSGHYCGRADEIGYDPKDHIILIANPSPLSKAAGHAPIDPYVTFISADSPYSVLGTLSFAKAGGIEQPLWDSGLGKFLLTVPGILGTSLPIIAVINPSTRMVERTISIDCASPQIGTVSASITGIALAPYQHVLVSACGFPITLNALTGHIYNVIKQVGGGDEVWYNSGDGRFYVNGPPNGVGLAADAQLGVIDAQKSKWLQNIPVPRGRNPAAFSENNRIFSFAAITAAMVATPSTDTSVCATKFGIAGRGCIAVFAHAGEKEDDDK